MSMMGELNLSFKLIMHLYLYPLMKPISWLGCGLVDTLIVGILAGF